MAGAARPVALLTLLACLLIMLAQDMSIVTDSRDVFTSVLTHGSAGTGSGLLSAAEFDIGSEIFTGLAERGSLTTHASGDPLSGKACPPGCEAHGTCNRELGVCDCIAYMGGPACDVSLVPGCRKLWGLELPIPPCQALEMDLPENFGFPPSCECLAECHALNARLAYVDHCVNASGKYYTAGSEGWPPKPGPPAPYPWKDPWGDGRWMRQAYFQGKRGVGESESSLLARNLALASKLTTDSEASVRGKLCSGRGLYTEVMPWANPGRYTAKYCHCFPGWYGEQCQLGPGDAAAPAVKQVCVHACSGRGICKLNMCHCVPGTWGIDCGMGTPDAAAANLAELEQRRRGLGAPYGWPSTMLATPAPTLPSPASKQLKIFVYHLPPRFNVWLAAHFRRTGRWDQSYLYSLDAKLHRWLLRSPYRTLDPAEADYFFVPAYPSLGFYDYEFGLYWLAGRGHLFLREAMDYVRMTHPWFNQSRGANHLLVMTNDKGATFIRGSVPQLENVNLITQWGWVRPHIHRRGTDVVVPPMLKVDKLIGESPFMGREDKLTAYMGASSSGYAYLLSFVGSVRFHTPGYSMGVRQKIFRRYNQTERFFLRDLRGDSYKGPRKALDPREYLRVLQQSKFCLAPSGMGFSTRSYESMAQGCVPLIIQDDPDSNTTVDQAFEEILPWTKFSLRLKQTDIPNLPKLLADYPDERWRELRRNLACAWPRTLWLNSDNEAPGIQKDEKGKANATASLGAQGYLSNYDAMESIMHTLRRRLARKRGETLPPFEWRTPASSCKSVQGPSIQTEGPVSAAS